MVMGMAIKCFNTIEMINKQLELGSLFGDTPVCIIYKT